MTYSIDSRTEKLLQEHFEKTKISPSEISIDGIWLSMSDKQKQDHFYECNRFMFKEFIKQLGSSK